MKFKKGDVVRCTNGRCKTMLGDNDGRGYGWKKGLKFTVKDWRVNSTAEIVYWNGDDGGIYEEALELATITDWKSHMEDLL